MSHGAPGAYGIVGGRGSVTLGKGWTTVRLYLLVGDALG